MQNSNLDVWEFGLFCSFDFLKLDLLIFLMRKKLSQKKEWFFNLTDNIDQASGDDSVGKRKEIVHVVF